MLNGRSATLVASLVCAVPSLAGDPPTPEAQTAPAKAWGPVVGEKAPGGELLNATSEPVQIESLYGKGPVVIIFYRGSWCPYCTRSLRDYDAHMDEFKAMNATIVAISPEKPGYASQMTNTNELDYTAYADAKGDVCRNFNLTYNLDEATRGKLKSFRIDLADRNADAQWSLPHPATIVIDKQGVVRNVWVNEDYTKRADPKDVLEAVKALGH